MASYIYFFINVDINCSLYILRDYYVYFFGAGVNCATLNGRYTTLLVAFLQPSIPHATRLKLRSLFIRFLK